MQYTIRFLTITALFALPLAGKASAQLVEAVVVPASNSEYNEDGVQSSADATLLERLDAYESRLRMLESDLQRPVAHECKNTAISSTRIFTNSVGCSSTYAGFELAVLKAHVGAIGISVPPIPLNASITGPFDYDVAPRVYLGHELASGLGIRATYFHFDDRGNPSQLGITTGLELQSFDLEATNRTKFFGTELLVSGGVRYAQLQQDYQQTLVWESEGVGLTMSAQLTRDIGRTNLDLFAGGRGSILMTDNEIGIPGLLVLTNDESTMKIWEGRIGVRHNFAFSNGANLISEVAMETQNWDSAAIAGIIGNDISLIGPAFRMTLSF